VVKTYTAIKVSSKLIKKCVHLIKGHAQKHNGVSKWKWYANT